MGTSLHEMLDLQRVDPTYHLVFDDGSKLALTSDMKSMQEQLEAFEPGSFEGLLRYMQEGHRHYHVGMEKLVSRDFRKASEFFTVKQSAACLPAQAIHQPLPQSCRHTSMTHV